MPSSINVNGATVYRPSIQGTADASALGGKGTSTGNLALLLDYGSFEQDEIHEFTSARALSDFDPTDDTLRLLGKLAFDPSADDRIPGGASTLVVVSTTTSTQAGSDIDDANGDASIRIDSRQWGTRGNRLAYDASLTGDTYDFTFVRDGLTEEFSVETAVFGTVNYTGVIAPPVSAATLTWRHSSEVTVAQQRTSAAAAPGGPGAQIPAMSTGWEQVRTQGTVDIRLSVSPAGGVIVTITGTDLGGAPLVEAVTLTNPAVTATTAGEFGSISSVTATSVTVGWVGTVRIDTFESIPVTGRTIRSILEEIGQWDGFVTTIDHPRAGSYDAEDADDLAETTILASALDIRADVATIITALGASRLVEASRGANGRRPDLAAPLAGVRLTGGSQSSPVGTTDWQDALDVIVDQDVQIVVPLTDDADVAALLPAHCNAAALQGYERNAWVGTQADQSLAQAFTGWSAPINSRFVSVVAQSVEVSHPNGTTPTLDPPYLALILGAMQAGRSVGIPLTRKRPDIRTAIQSWAENRDAAEAIRKGLVVLSRDRLGWLIERSITCYLTDDNPILSEMSAWESIQWSIRDLRNALNDRIGNPAIAGTAGRLKGAAQTRLNEQVVEGGIKAWRNLSIDDLGDTYRINYEAAAVEPINFIVIAVSVVRIAGV